MTDDVGSVAGRPQSAPPASQLSLSLDRGMHVVGAPRRSLFDAVRPSDVQQQGSGVRGIGGMALSALRHPGVTGGEHTPADAVVVGGRAFGTPKPGWIAAGEVDALAVAYGVASIRSRRTAGGRTWVLLRVATLREGDVLEAAALLPTLAAVPLCPVVVGAREEGRRAAGLLRTLGLVVHEADNDDAWSVLSALDHAVRDAERTSVAVVASREGGAPEGDGDARGPSGG